MIATDFMMCMPKLMNFRIKKKSDDLLAATLFCMVVPLLLSHSCEQGDDEK